MARLLEASFPNSSSITKVSFDPTLKVLTVTFKGGGTYHYFGVHRELVEQMLATRDAGESAGKFFHKNIRTKFQFERVAA